MDFKIGDQVKRKSTGEEGVIVQKPPFARSPPRLYVHVKLAGHEEATVLPLGELEPLVP